MHDCCQAWNALWLIVKRVGSRTHLEQCAESIVLAKSQGCTADQLHSFSCYMPMQIWVCTNICCCIEAAEAL